MSETARQLAVDAVAELYADRQRTHAALALLHPIAAVEDLRTHWDGCHHTHVGCLARQAIAALTGEDHHRCPLSSCPP